MAAAFELRTAAANFQAAAAAALLRLSPSLSHRMMKQQHLMKQQPQMMTMPLVGLALLLDIVRLLLLMLLHYASHVLYLLFPVLAALRRPSLH